MRGQIFGLYILHLTSQKALFKAIVRLYLTKSRSKLMKIVRDDFKDEAIVRVEVAVTDINTRCFCEISQTNVCVYLLSEPSQLALFV
jgi:hypothetical protein